MKPITFTCSAALLVPRSKIFDGVSTPAEWSTFTGFGPVPGIESASYEVRETEMTGSIIVVQNMDGTTHRERILEWIPEKRIVLELTDFPSPLASLATHFTETWTFEAGNSGDVVKREFVIEPQSRISRPLLWIISRFLKKAVQRQLDQIARD